MTFSEQLLDWWDKHGRKDLPWQHPRSAYRVWIAEVMLQQTQVRTVAGYFERFVGRFPDIQSLAAATMDDVLACWSGLGYYARARNLLKAARICVESHAGQLPGSPAALAALPGIGASTANAIYSQAYDRPAAILDGNVKRVLARYRAIGGWPGKPDIHRQLWLAAEELLPARRGADYTQAIMDLGATLCTRTKPACARCPVNRDCGAFTTGRVDQFPARRPALKTGNKSFRMLILTDGDGRVLLERRPPAGIWGGLWSLPSDDDGRPIQQRLPVLDTRSLQPLDTLQHQLTHLQMTIQPMIGYADLLAGGVECTQDQRWFDRHEWPALGLPGPVRHLLETYLEKNAK